MKISATRFSLGPNECISMETKPSSVQDLTDNNPAVCNPYAAYSAACRRKEATGQRVGKICCLFIFSRTRGREGDDPLQQAEEWSGYWWLAWRKTSACYQSFYELLNLKCGFSPELIAIIPASLNSNNMWVFFCTDACPPDAPADNRLLSQEKQADFIRPPPAFSCWTLPVFAISDSEQRLLHPWANQCWSS